MPKVVTSKGKTIHVMWKKGNYGYIRTKNYFMKIPLQRQKKTWTPTGREGTCKWGGLFSPRYAVRYDDGHEPLRANIPVHILLFGFHLQIIILKYIIKKYIIYSLHLLLVVYVHKCYYGVTCIIKFISTGENKKKKIRIIKFKKCSTLSIKIIGV
jgi:hypothetical protein